jgi:hypothetical protein
MSKKAAPIGQEVTFREDKQDRPERRDAFSDNGDYSKGELEAMGSRELLDGYAE